MDFQEAEKIFEAGRSEYYYDRSLGHCVEIKRTLIVPAVKETERFYFEYDTEIDLKAKTFSKEWKFSRSIHESGNAERSASYLKKCEEWS